MTPEYTEPRNLPAPVIATGKEYPVLIVDDSESDIILMQYAFRKANIASPVFTVNDGVEAVAYLRGEGIYSDRESYPLPGLVYLDLKMPGMNGFEVLEWIRATPELHRLMVVVLTSSARQEDIDHAFTLHANAFFVKPSALDELQELLAAVHQMMKFNQFPRLVPAPPRSAT